VTVAVLRVAASEVLRDDPHRIERRMRVIDASVEHRHRDAVAAVARARRPNLCDAPRRINLRGHWFRRTRLDEPGGHGGTGGDDGWIRGEIGPLARRNRLDF
jgi:hypothetical protein